ncbi:MAG: hypothetical protein ABR548_03450 [Actinomycetota bacterium]|nr:hypothetical protein [Actinomycetota bacterium]
MDKRKIRIVLLIGVVLAMVFGFAPAHAAGGVVCQVEGTVLLDNGGGYENLILVNGGFGTVSGNVACEGSVAGTFPLSGAFSFCKHGDATHSGCSSTPLTGTSPLEPAYNALAATPIVTDIVGNMSITSGSNSCSWNLQGHSLGVVADLRLDSFKCNGISYPTARAEATAAPVIIPGGVVPGIDCTAGPGGLKACFNQLAIVGGIEAVQ